MVEKAVGTVGKRPVSVPNLCMLDSTYYTRGSIVFDHYWAQGSILPVLTSYCTTDISDPERRDPMA